MDNLIYALIQLLHNMGAVTVVAAPAYIVINHYQSTTTHQDNVALVAVVGWSLQILTGLGFGLASYQLHGHIPQLETIAKAALGIKILCALVSLSLLTMLIFNKMRISVRVRWLIGCIALLLSVLALFAAAFLRWYG